MKLHFLISTLWNKYERKRLKFSLCFGLSSFPPLFIGLQASLHKFMSSCPHSSKNVCLYVDVDRSLNCVFVVNKHIMLRKP